MFYVIWLLISLLSLHLDKIQKFIGTNLTADIEINIPVVTFKISTLI